MTTAINKLHDTKLRPLIGKTPSQTPSGDPQQTPSKAKKLADGGGLFLLHTPAGGLIWKLKFRIGGVEQLLTFGNYPAVTLSQARQMRDDARACLAAGNDPREVKKIAEAAAAELPATFRRFAQEVLDALPTGTVKTDKTFKKWSIHLGYAMRHFGDQPIGDIFADEVRDWLVATFVKSNPPRLDTMRSVKQKIDKVMRLGAIGRHCAGPFGEILRGSLPAPVSVAHPAITDDPAAFGAMLRKIDRHRGDPAVRAALQFQALTFQRPGMVYAMTWGQVDFANAIWAIPAEGMKGPDGKAQDHLVPLSPQALAVLTFMKTISGPEDGKDGFVFPGRQAGKQMSATAMNMALKRLGFGGVQVAHGFRASATTMLMERLGWDEKIIDVAVAHVIGDETRAAYNRAKWLDQRREMFAAWGDYLDALRAGTVNVHKFKAVA